MSRFWRTTAVIAILGLIYVGHGLHQGDGHSFLPTAEARYGIPPRIKPVRDQTERFVTSNEDGTVVFVWQWHEGMPIDVGRLNVFLTSNRSLIEPGMDFQPSWDLLFE